MGSRLMQRQLDGFARGGDCLPRSFVFAGIGLTNRQERFATRGELAWRSGAGRTKFEGRRRLTALIGCDGPADIWPRPAADDQNHEQLKNQNESQGKKGKKGGKGTREGTPCDARFERALQVDRPRRLAYGQSGMALDERL